MCSDFQAQLNFLPIIQPKKSERILSLTNQTIFLGFFFSLFSFKTVLTEQSEKCEQFRNKGYRLIRRKSDAF